MDKTLELIKLAQQGDTGARDQIVNDNLGLVWSIVRRFTNRGYDADDLFQIGSIGLLKCIEKFDLSYDVKFSTYAVPMIMGEIKRFLRDDGIIKISRPLKEISQKAKYVQEDFTHKNGRPPTINELAELTGANMDDLVMALESTMEVESLYSTVNYGESGQIYLIDKLDQCEGHDSHMIDIIALKQIINQLSPRERQIIKLRYFQDKTQAQIADQIGVSQVQVSRIEKKVLKDIRNKFG